MNLKQMIQRQQELLDLAKAEKRELTAEEQKEFDSLQASIDALRASAENSDASAPAQASTKSAEPDMTAIRTSVFPQMSISRAEDLLRALRVPSSIHSVRITHLFRLEDRQMSQRMSRISSDRQQVMRLFCVPVSPLSIPQMVHAHSWE